MQTAPQDKARIAAEVAARYGVTVSPDAVQIVPRGVSSFPGYIYEGTQLVPIVKRPRGEAIKEKISASWREAARKRRVGRALRDADAEAAPKPERHKINDAARIAKIRAQAEAKADVIRTMAARGANLDAIAKHMGVTTNSARKYCDKYRIKPAPKPTAPAVVAAERKAKVLAFCEGGQRTVEEVADMLGCTRNAAQKYLTLHGIAYSNRRTFDQAKEDRRAAIAARVAERREKVRAMFCEGMDGQQIATALGTTRGPIWKDIRSMGLRRADYPLAKAAPKPKPQRKAPDLSERRQLVAQLTADGMTVAAIAGKLRASYAAIQRDRQALGIRAPVATSGHVGNPQLVARVAAMRARKMSLREIAVALSLAKSTAFRLIKAVEAA